MEPAIDDDWLCWDMPLRLRWSPNLSASQLGPDVISLSLRVAVNRKGDFQLGTFGKEPQEHLLVLAVLGGIDNYRTFHNRVLPQELYGTPHDAHIDTDDRQNLLAEFFEDIYGNFVVNNVISNGPASWANIYACPIKLHNVFEDPITVLHARIHHQQFDYSWYPEDQRPIYEKKNKH